MMIHDMLQAKSMEMNRKNVFTFIVNYLFGFCKIRISFCYFQIFWYLFFGSVANFEHNLTS